MTPHHQKVGQPLLRGWLHAIAALCAFGLVFGLFSQIEDPARRSAMSIFGTSMILMYTVSATYHIGRWGPRMHRILKSFDHANIFVLIAGSYTPFCVMVLHGWVASFLLIGLWSGAAIGVVIKIGWPYLPHTISLTWYMTMSWMGILALPQLIMALPWIALGFLGTGALCYTAGGIIFGLRKPNPLPHIFGYHELFHLLGVTANAIVIFTLFTWILPYA